MLLLFCVCLLMQDYFRLFFVFSLLQLVVVIFSLRIAALVKEQDVDWRNVTDFPRIGQLARIASMETDLISVLVLIAWFQLLPVLSVFRKLRHVFTYVFIPFSGEAKPYETSP